MNKPRQYHSDLSTLLNGIHHVPSALNTQIHGLVADSREVRQGDLFVALAGENSPADTYVQDAIERGAAAVLIDCSGLGASQDYEAHEDGRAVELFIPDLKAHLGELAHRFYHRPSDELEMIGVTGTNGKTSVVNYIAQFFALTGVSTAVIGTLGYGMCADGEALIDTNHTTPGVVDLHRILAHLRDAGAEVVAMEVSSHGLVQGRVDGVRFDGAVFTNLSRDHLDYHQTMQQYAQAKSRLFSVSSLKYAVINTDDDYAQVMFQQVAPETKKIRYSLSAQAEVFAKDLMLSGRTSGCLCVGSNEITFDSALIGRFNVYNVLAVMGVALARSCSIKELEKVNLLKPVAGRIEALRSEGQPIMIVDYAHTPDALENVAQTLRDLVRGELLVVFGCGGDRDRGKRKEMATVAEQYADHCIVTDDNPRTEESKAIFDDIALGFAEPNAVKFIHDREEAIRTAFERASQDDIVLVAGKGHENYQEIMGEHRYFSDRDICMGLLGLTSRQSEGVDNDR